MAGIWERAAWQVAQKAAQSVKIPAKIAQKLPLAKKILGGDFAGAIEGFVGEKLGLPFFGGNIYGPPLGETPLLGGLSPQEVLDIYQEVSTIAYSRKNLFFINITDLKADLGKPLANLNMLTTSVSYAGLTISGDNQRIGGGSMHLPANREVPEIRITVYDDQEGSIKRWFYTRADIMINPDGTHGLPIDYLMKMQIVHGFVNDMVTGSENAWVDTFVVKPTSLEVDKSRQEDGLDELQITLTAFDTFYNP